MISTKTPLRISFVGGGTDYPAFFNKSEGHVVGCTVDLNVYVNILELPRFAREKFRFTYRKTESVGDINEMEHPVTRELLKYLNWTTPLNIATMADVPGSSGLGSSSAFSVGLALALKTFERKEASALYLAEIATRIEREILGEPGGIQDQYQTSFGGFRSYTFKESGVEISDAYLDQSSLDKLSRFFTLLAVGGERHSSSLAAETSLASSDGRFQELLAMRNLSRGLSIKLNGRLPIASVASELFSAIEESWEIKKRFSPLIAPREVNDAIERGKELGATTAKLCGAGSSGFILFGHSPEKQEEIISNFPDKFAFPVNFVENGSQVILQPSDGHANE